MSRPDLTQLKSFIDNSKSISILLPKVVSYDQIASALSLKLALENTGKSINVITSSPVTVEFNRLVGVDTVSSTLGSPNLVISFENQSELVDSVSYDLDKGELKLVITPKSGNTTQIDHKLLKFTPSASKPDLIVTVGVDALDDLGDLHSQIKDFISSTKVVALHKRQTKSNYATHHVTHPETSSLCEFVTIIIDSLGLQLHEDIATNLYHGLLVATENFQTDSVSHETFEIASLLLRRGARRDKAISAKDFPAGSIPGQSPRPITGFGTDHKEPEMQINPTTVSPKPKTPSSDWYEPKIYRGPMLP